MKGVVPAIARSSLFYFHFAILRLFRNGVDFIHVDTVQVQVVKIQWLSRIEALRGKHDLCEPFIFLRVLSRELYQQIEIHVSIDNLGRYL